MIRVSAAIIKNEIGEILICQRGAGGSCEYLWEFPGGKIEPKESPEECLIRECKEELEIDIEIQNLYAETIYAYPEREIAFLFFCAKIVHGKPTADVHELIKWVFPDKLILYEFCPADKVVVEKLAKSQ